MAPKDQRLNTVRLKEMTTVSQITRSLTYIFRARQVSRENNNKIPCPHLKLFCCLQPDSNSISQRGTGGGGVSLLRFLPDHFRETRAANSFCAFVLISLGR
jgi:hypothetical protein